MSITGFHKVIFLPVFPEISRLRQVAQFVKMNSFSQKKELPIRKLPSFLALSKKSNT